jgi:hypothetical protein
MVLKMDSRKAVAKALKAFTARDDGVSGNET